MTPPTTASSFEASFRGFACPLEGLDKLLLQSVAREHSRETVRRFLEQYRPTLNRCGYGIVDQLELWLGNVETDFASCWHDAFGDARLLLGRTDTTVAVNIGAALALHMGSCGLPGEWEIDLSSPAQYRWGRWLLGESRRITVLSDGSAAVVRTSSDATDQEIRVMRSDGEWLPESGNPTQLPLVGTQRSQVVLLPKAAVEKGSVIDTFPPLLEEIPAEITALWQDAFTLIGRHAPIYDAWVQDVVRHIALLETSVSGMVHSGSYHYRDGLIHASSRSSLMSLAEVLVHEASHQYFYLLSRLGQVDDGTDKNLYYSPLAATERSLDRILLAYHACGNIVLLYRLCQQNGAPDSGVKMSL